MQESDNFYPSKFPSELHEIFGDMLYNTLIALKPLERFIEASEDEVFDLAKNYIAALDMFRAAGSKLIGEMAKFEDSL